MEHPEVFISYSWTNEPHIERTLELAVFLRENGVDVRIDRWNLREGQDSNAFMEQMVAKSGADKVIMICDRAYKEKADSRVGGVGTEAQIMTPEIYAQKEDIKYLAVVTELDEDGKPFMPSFYGARIFVDISDRSKDTASFDRIIRWVFGKPSDIAPEIGAIPSYLLNDDTHSVTAGSKLTRAVSSLRSGSKSLEFDLDDGINSLLTAIEKLGDGFNREASGEDFIDELPVIASLRDEAITLFSSIIGTGEIRYFQNSCETFFERLFALCQPGRNKSRYSDWDADRQRFFAQEFILYLVAELVRRRRYDWLGEFLTATYFLDHEQGAESLGSIRSFQTEIKILDFINSRRSQQRVSLFADLVKERCETTAFEFRALQQADALIFVSTSANRKEDAYFWYWYPSTLILSSHRLKLPFFEKAKVESGLQNLLSAVGVSEKKMLKKAFLRPDGQEVQIGRMFGVKAIDLLGLRSFLNAD